MDAESERKLRLMTFEGLCACKCLLKSIFRTSAKEKPHSEMQIKVILCCSKNNNNTFAMMFCKRVITFQPLSFWVTSGFATVTRISREPRPRILSGFAFLRRSTSISMTPLTPPSEPLVSLELWASSRRICCLNATENVRGVRISKNTWCDDAADQDSSWCCNTAN